MPSNCEAELGDFGLCRLWSSGSKMAVGPALNSLFRPGNCDEARAAGGNPLARFPGAGGRFGHQPFQTAAARPSPPCSSPAARTLDGFERPTAGRCRRRPRRITEAMRRTLGTLTSIGRPDDRLIGPSRSSRLRAGRSWGTGCELIGRAPLLLRSSVPLAMAWWIWFSNHPSSRHRDPSHQRKAI
jgi:hypothetical protein